MSSNDIVRITEMEDGTWEVLQCDVDMDVDKYSPRSTLLRYDTLDAALDRAQSMYAEYGLDIVRLKDQQQDTIESAAGDYARHVLDTDFSFPNENLEQYLWFNQLTKAFHAGADHVLSSYS